MSSSNSLLKKIFILNLIVINFSSFLFAAHDENDILRNLSRGYPPVSVSKALEKIQAKRYFRKLHFNVNEQLRETRIFSEFLNGMTLDNYEEKIGGASPEIEAVLIKLCNMKIEGESKEDNEIRFEQISWVKKRIDLLNNLKRVTRDNFEDTLKEIKQNTGADIKSLDEELGRIKAELEGFKGDIIFRGIAGEKNWKMVEDLKVGDDITKGFLNGVMLRGALSVGNSIGTSLEHYINSLFTGTLGKVEELVSYIYRLIFHSACRPYSPEEIKYWKDLIGKDLREIETMIRNAEKNDSRGRSEILREYEEEESEKHTINLWQDFIEDLAITYEELAEEIEIRKNYYRKNNNGYGVVNCANRLQNKLLKTKDIFLSVKSLKELANLPEAKSIVPTMRKSFDNYFDNLADLIRPLKDKKSPVTGSGSSYSSNRTWGDDSSYSSGAYPNSRSDVY